MSSIVRNSEQLKLLKRDIKLVKESIAGNSQSFAKLVSFYQTRIQAVGRSFFKNEADTEDFVQDVFLKAYMNLSSFKGESQFSTWLIRIAYTTAINSKSRRKEYLPLEDDTIIPSEGKTPEENQMLKLTAQAVREAVKELPQNYAVCLDFYFFFDFSYEEISVITGFPVNTIKSHIFRAKQILRTKLQDFSQAR
jgi:RNA polymerase sigma-70 factor, ECF subfamily